MEQVEEHIPCAVGVKVNNEGFHVLHLRQLMLLQVQIEDLWGWRSLILSKKQGNWFFSYGYDGLFHHDGRWQASLWSICPHDRSSPHFKALLDLANCQAPSIAKLVSKEVIFATITIGNSEYPICQVRTNKCLGWNLFLSIYIHHCWSPAHSPFLFVYQIPQLSFREKSCHWYYDWSWLENLGSHVLRKIFPLSSAHSSNWTWTKQCLFRSQTWELYVFVAPGKDIDLKPSVKV